jgi:hypothetical protein
MPFICKTPILCINTSQSPKVKFLGILLDLNLKFLYHIKQISVKNFYFTVPYDSCKKYLVLKSTDNRLILTNMFSPYICHSYME